MNAQLKSATPTVLVAGAGAVGSVLALALSRSGIAVTLVDKQVAEPVPDTHAARRIVHGLLDGASNRDRRPIALSASSARILNTLDVWQQIAPYACPIQMVHVGEQGRFGVVRLRASEHRVPALGYVTDAAVIAAALAPAVAAAQQITCIQGAQVYDGLVRADHIRVLLDDQDSEQENRIATEAQLLVVADGGHSSLSANLGISSKHRDYQQVAVVCTVTPERAHQGTAYERFTCRGPLALLPMAGGDCALVWTLPRDLAEDVAALDDAGFVQALRSAFGRRLGRFTAVTGRSVFPLTLVRAQQLRTARVALIGNAANQLHPVAGQGLNLGLRDAAMLADVIVDALRAGADLGGDALLQRYARRRRAEHQGIVHFTDALAHGFSAGPPWLGWLRSSGMLALDLLPVGRHLLARRAMGLGSPQARLVRGLNP